MTGRLGREGPAWVGQETRDKACKHTGECVGEASRGLDGVPRPKVCVRCAVRGTRYARSRERSRGLVRLRCAALRCGAAYSFLKTDGDAELKDAHRGNSRGVRSDR